jgi:hypothetical protein
MPIVLVFESVPILTADGTRFTPDNAASAAAIPGDTAEFLRNIPFQRVYHAGAMMQAEKADITYRRCAEVLVPNELGLDHLRRVLCRSQAEHETLLDLLTEEARTVFANRIGVSDRVHYKQWTFLEGVDKSAELVTFRFYPFSNTPQPFLVRAEFRDANNQLRGHWEQLNFCANGKQGVSIAQLQLAEYRVQLTLDGLLAYSGTFGAMESLL